jgi:hypothetical protein
VNKIKIQFSVFLLLSMLFLTGKVSAQAVSPSLNYDSLSYEQYLRKDWKALLETAKLMQEKGIDYYYLRMRLGIASLATHNFIGAEKHFRQALIFNPDDQNAIAYLQKALSANNKDVESGALWPEMNTAGKENSGLKDGFVPVSVHADVGAVFRSNTEGLSFEKLSGVQGIYGQERIYQDNLFYDAGFYFKANPRWLLYGGFQWIDITATDRFAYLEPELALESVAEDDFGKSYYYTLGFNPKTINFDHQLTQRSGYLQAAFGASTRLKFVGGLHMMKVNRNFSVSEEISANLQDTSYFNKITGEATLYNTSVSSLKYTTIPWQTNDYSLTLNSHLHLGKITALAGVGLGSINDSSVFQLNAGWLFQPFGNINTYNQTEVFLVNTEGKNQWIFKSRFGVRPFKTTWLEAEIMAGRLNNLSDQYGYIVYNSPEKQNLRFEATLSQSLTKKLLLQLRYRFLDSEREYNSIDNDGQSFITKTYQIQSQTVIGGIKWIF